MVRWLCCISLVVLATSRPLCPRLSAQTIGGRERARGHTMLRTVRESLEKHYYDSTFHGIDLRAAAARADSQIQVAQSNGQIFRIIAQFVQALDDSHTRFYPPRRIADIKYGWEIQMIGDSCYVVRVDPKSDAAAKGLRVGDRVIAIGPYQPSRRYFSPLLHALYAINPTPLVTLDVEAADGARRTLDIQSKVTERPRTIDFSAYIRELELAERRPFAEVTTRGKKVMILRLGWFVDRPDMDRAMAGAHKVGILILDLRGNGGGPEDGLVRLVGHVFDRRVVIATIHRRRDTRAVESKPVGHPFTGPLFVLIDSRSASASEAFAYLIQMEGRGIVLGDRSAGAVMRSRIHELTTAFGANPYGLTITDADVIMPDGTRLEGRGVRPDSLVLPTAADLASGRDPVLALALTMAGYPTDAARAGELLSRPGEKQ
jgi:carboxyl-terminal processing protease